jgi:hypothetical protein
VECILNSHCDGVRCKNGVCLKKLNSKCSSNGECDSDLCVLGICSLVNEDCETSLASFRIGMSFDRESQGTNICNTTLSGIYYVYAYCQAANVLSFLGINKSPPEPSVKVLANCSVHNNTYVTSEDVIQFNDGLCYGGFSHTLFYDLNDSYSDFYSWILNDIATNVKIDSFEFIDSDDGFSPVHYTSKYMGEGSLIRTCESSVVYSSGVKLVYDSNMIILLFLAIITHQYL